MRHYREEPPNQPSAHEGYHQRCLNENLDLCMSPIRQVEEKKGANTVVAAAVAFTWWKTRPTSVPQDSGEHPDIAAPPVQSHGSHVFFSHVS